MSQSLIERQQFDNRRYWLALADKCRFKINLAWWLDYLTVPLVVATITASLAVVFARKHLPDASPGYLVGGILLTLGVAALAAYLMARRHFETQDCALTRIDAHLKLDNALTSAQRGVALWPAIEGDIENPAGNHWRPFRLSIPLLGALALLATSYFIPISAMSATSSSAHQPHAWQVLDAALEELDAEEIVEKEYLEEKKQELEKLKQKDSEEWFSHSTLEATDNLHNTLKSDAAKLQRQLEQADHTLNQLSEFGPEMGENAQKRLVNEFQNALDQMNASSMKPNKELADKLNALAPDMLEKLKNMDPDELEKLKQKMQGAMDGLEKLGGNGWPEQRENGDGKPGDGEGEDQPPGQGGAQRGPGHAGNATGKEKEQLQTGNIIPLESKDDNAPLPGDLLQTTDSEHDVDKTPSVPQAGGTAQNKGDGGNRVWKNSLLPKEKKALKNFLK